MLNGIAVILCLHMLAMVITLNEARWSLKEKEEEEDVDQILLFDLVRKGWRDGNQTQVTTDKQTGNLTINEIGLWYQDSSSFLTLDSFSTRFLRLPLLRIFLCVQLLLVI